MTDITNFLSGLPFASFLRLLSHFVLLACPFWCKSARPTMKTLQYLLMLLWRQHDMWYFYLFMVRLWALLLLLSSPTACYLLVHSDASRRDQLWRHCSTYLCCSEGNMTCDTSIYLWCDSELCYYYCLHQLHAATTGKLTINHIIQQQQSRLCTTYVLLCTYLLS